MAELNIPAGVGEGQGDAALAAAQDDLDAILKGGPSPEPLVQPSEAPPPPPAGMIPTIGRNVAEVPRAVGSGVVRGFDAVIGLGDMLQDAMPVSGFQLFDMEGNFSPSFVSPEEIARDTEARNEAGYAAIPNPLARPETTTGQLTEGMAQFLTGFVTGGAALKAVGAAKSLPFFARASGQGMFSDFAAFDGHEERHRHSGHDTEHAEGDEVAQQRVLAQSQDHRSRQERHDDHEGHDRGHDAPSGRSGSGADGPDAIRRSSTSSSTRSSPVISC
jgi:hypothetical protein